MPDMMASGTMPAQASSKSLRLSGAPGGLSRRSVIAAHTAADGRSRMVARTWSGYRGVQESNNGAHPLQRKVHLQRLGPISLPILDQRSTPTPLADGPKALDRF